MEGSLEPKVAATLGLDFIPVVEVGSSSTSEDVQENVGSILAVEEVATPETSVNPNFKESVPVPVGGKNASGVASSFMGLVEEIVRVAGELKD